MIVRENDKEKDSKKYRGREKWWETWQWANVGDRSETTQQQPFRPADRYFQREMTCQL